MSSYTKDELEAVRMYENGLKPSCSTSIDENSILVGYGALDHDFEFPLPVDYIKKYMVHYLGMNI